MSYDLRLAVKVEGWGQMVMIGEPEYSSPTYNLGKMFRACMDWNFKQGEYYNCAEVIKNIDHGIRELRTNPGKYKDYEPDNGWGTVQTAIEALESLRSYIFERAEDIPIECLWVAW